MVQYVTFYFWYRKNISRFQHILQKNNRITSESFSNKGFSTVENKVPKFPNWNDLTSCMGYILYNPLSHNLFSDINKNIYLVLQRFLIVFLFSLKRKTYSFHWKFSCNILEKIILPASDHGSQIQGFIWFKQQIRSLDKLNPRNILLAEWLDLTTFALTHESTSGNAPRLPLGKAVKLKLCASSKLSTNFSLRSSSLLCIPIDSSVKAQSNSFRLIIISKTSKSRTYERRW